MNNEQQEREYSVVRFFRDDPSMNRVIESGLTREEAQAHCQRDDTRGDGWFDGFDRLIVGFDDCS